MKYNLEWLISKIKAEGQASYIFFWGHQPSKDGKLTQACFSQWWAADFSVNGIVYKTAEHWMMAEKARLFGDLETLEQILTAISVHDVKSFGRKVKGFDENRWLEKRFDIVVEGNFHKFKQNKDLRDFLLQTGDKVIVEASPIDTVWGIGMAKDSSAAENPGEWQGLNLLGFALMEVRDKIRQEENR